MRDHLDERFREVHKVPTGTIAWDTLHKECGEVKAHIAEFLGIEPGGVLELDLSPYDDGEIEFGELDNKHRRLASAIGRFATEVGDAMPMLCSKFFKIGDFGGRGVFLAQAKRFKDGQRIGAALGRLLRKGDSHYHAVWEEACAMFMHTPYEYVHNFSRAWQELTSMVHGGGGVTKAYVSLDVADILGASERSNFSSCFAVNGAYKHAPRTFATDNSTAVLFMRSLSDDKEKMMRAWIHFNVKSRCWSINRVYGFYSPKKISAIIEALNARIEDVTGEDMVCGHKEVSVYLQTRPSAVYWDGGAYGCGFHDGDRCEVIVNFPGSMCLRCGKPSKYRKKNEHGLEFFCDECLEEVTNTCEICNNRSFLVGRVIDGKEICETCYEREYFTCEECNKDIRIDDTPGVLYRERICSDCAAKTRSICQVCESVRNEPGHELCEECEGLASAGELVRCTSCGKWARENINGVCIGNGCHSKSIMEELADLLA